ncbi:MAG TPA: hypothetical protein VFO70_07470 [Chitinophagaceae bacterium]|nr:hypothetical protein [Chitinophagaceae bacterium]HEX5651478.1 hypothetical protein [Chitinophagaceae bacterium]
MKKTIKLFLPLTILLLTACQKRNSPVITQRSYEPPRKNITIYPPEGTVVPDTVTGKTIFINRCDRCHGLPDPILYSQKRWVSILEIMIPRARLVPEQAVHLRAFILGKSKEVSGS